ncbi:SAV_915 family protein [Streptomyces sp. NPDC002676]
MGAPIRSRLLDLVEPEPPKGPATAAATGQAPQPRRSHLLDLVDAAPPPRPEGDDRPAPKPGVPAYDTPVFVPAHPRSVAASDAQGHPVRVPFVVYELFEHPADGTVALAFTTPRKLAQALGEAQPWVATPIGPLAENVRERGMTVVLDPRVAPGGHNWQPADLAAYAQEVRR